MGVISHRVSVDVGHYIAQPNGQRRLTRLCRRVVGLAHSPRATQLPECGRGLMCDHALAAQRAIAGRHATTDLTTSDSITADLITTDTAGGDPLIDRPSRPEAGVFAGNVSGRAIAPSLIRGGHELPDL